MSVVCLKSFFHSPTAAVLSSLRAPWSHTGNNQQGREEEGRKSGESKGRSGGRKRAGEIARDQKTMAKEGKSIVRHQSHQRPDKNVMKRHQNHIRGQTTITFMPRLLHKNSPARKRTREQTQTCAHTRTHMTDAQTLSFGKFHGILMVFSLSDF